MKLQRNGFDFIFLDRIYRIDGIFSPSARSPFGRRPFYPDDPVDLPARAFTHCLIFCGMEPYVSIRLVGRLYLHGRRVLSNFLLKMRIHSLFLPYFNLRFFRVSFSIKPAVYLPAAGLTPETYHTAFMAVALRQSTTLFQGPVFEEA